MTRIRWIIRMIAPALALHATGCGGPMYVETRCDSLGTTLRAVARDYQSDGSLQAGWIPASDANLAELHGLPLGDDHYEVREYESFRILCLRNSSGGVECIELERGELLDLCQGP